jgi:hypothetical protein
LVVGSPATFSTLAAGMPPFRYVWKKNGIVLSGQTANTITLNAASMSDAGTYSVEVTGGSGSVTNSAKLLLLSPTSVDASLSNGQLMLKWPAPYTGWRLESKTNTLTEAQWSDVVGTIQTNLWVVPIDAAVPTVLFRLTYP